MERKLIINSLEIIPTAKKEEHGLTPEEAIKKGLNDSLLNPGKTIFIFLPSGEIWAEFKDGKVRWPEGEFMAIDQST